MVGSKLNQLNFLFLPPSSSALKRDYKHITHCYKTHQRQDIVRLVSNISYNYIDTEISYNLNLEENKKIPICLINTSKKDKASNLFLRTLSEPVSGVVNCKGLDQYTDKK